MQCRRLLPSLQANIRSSSLPTQTRRPLHPPPAAATHLSHLPSHVAVDAVVNALQVAHAHAAAAAAANQMAGEAKRAAAAVTAGLPTPAHTALHCRHSTQPMLSCAISASTSPPPFPHDPLAHIAMRQPLSPPHTARRRNQLAHSLAVVRAAPFACRQDINHLVGQRALPELEVAPETVLVAHAAPATGVARRHLPSIDAGWPEAAADADLHGEGAKEGRSRCEGGAAVEW